MLAGKNISQSIKKKGHWHMFSSVYTGTLSAVHTLAQFQQCIPWHMFNSTYIGTFSAVHTLAHFQQCIHWHIFSSAYTGTLSAVHTLAQFQQCIQALFHCNAPPPPPPFLSFFLLHSWKHVLVFLAGHRQLYNGVTLNS